MRVLECDQARFWAKVALPNEQGCMLWLRATNEDGYGRFYLNGKAERAHRVSYLLAYGLIPEGTEIDHVRAKGCANRHCVAPLHLEAVTHAENNRRSMAGAALALRQAAKTHCPAGHLYAGNNLYIHPTTGGRRCRACGRNAARIKSEREKV